MTEAARGRWAASRWTLTAAMAVPLVALVVVCGLGVRDRASNVAAAQDQADIVEVLRAADGLLDALQLEGAFGSTYLVGLEGGADFPVPSNEEARSGTDSAIRAFERDLGGRDEGVREQYEPALEQLGQLPDLRQAVDSYTGDRSPAAASEPALDVYLNYEQVIRSFFDADTRLAGLISDADVRLGAELATLSARQIGINADLRRLLFLDEAASRGIDADTELPVLSRLAGTSDELDRSLRAASLGSYAPSGEEHLTAPEIEDWNTIVDDALRERSVDPSVVLDGHAALADGGYQAFRDDVLTQLDANTDQLTSDAASGRTTYLLGSLLAEALAVAATVLVGRALLGQRENREDRRRIYELDQPARLPEAVAFAAAGGRHPNGRHEDESTVDSTVLTASASAAAGQGLAVEVAARRRMGQRTPGTSDPAIQPAALRQAITGPFVNLGRRNQQLLDRQLAFITHLESGETDPDRLAGLFEVDHLATRMRRNAESLFVLAEVETQRSWGRSIAVVDVVRAALGEVASYERVTIQQIEPAALGGAVASDLAHIIAELIENALRFSPAEGDVTVDGRRSRDGYVLTIVDSGDGMSVADIDEANRRLSGADRSELAPSTQLGHHIAGRLAVRHGLAVRLDAVAGNSVRATVTVPPALIAVATAPDDATELMSPDA